MPGVPGIPAPGAPASHLMVTTVAHVKHNCMNTCMESGKHGMHLGFLAVQGLQVFLQTLRHLQQSILSPRGPAQASYSRGS